MKHIIKLLWKYRVLKLKNEVLEKELVSHRCLTERLIAELNLLRT